MEKRIVSEVDDFLRILKATNGQPTDLNPVLAVSISNVICDVLMSVKFSHNDARFIRFMELIEEGFKLFGSLEYVFFIPILKYLPGHTKTRQKIAKVSYFLTISIVYEYPCTSEWLSLLEDTEFVTGKGRIVLLTEYPANLDLKFSAFDLSKY